MKKFLIALSVLALGTAAFAQEDAQQAAAEAAKALSAAAETPAPAPKPQYWTNSLMTNLNFVQSSFSNWAKGGINNIAMSGYVDGNANYKKDDRMFWNNRLQLDYGFMYAEDKPIFQKNKDRILFESTWGAKTPAKHLNWSAKFTFLSQFTDGYTYGTPTVTNPKKKDWLDARTRKSGFLSPGIATLGLGIDWTPKKWLAVNFAPVTGGFTIVMDEGLRKNYGMERKGKYEDEAAYPDAKDGKGLLTNGYMYRGARFEFGAQLTVDAKVKINDNFEGSTHLLLFSNYLHNPQNIRVNWDNRLMWKLAKYFSLNLTTNLIYDDTVLIVDDEHPNGHRTVQFAEALQFGFTYTFATKKN